MFGIDLKNTECVEKRIFSTESVFSKASSLTLSEYSALILRARLMLEDFSTKAASVLKILFSTHSVFFRSIPNIVATFVTSEISSVDIGVESSFPKRTMFRRADTASFPTSGRKITVASSLQQGMSLKTLFKIGLNNLKIVLLPCRRLPSRVIIFKLVSFSDKLQNASEKFFSNISSL